ncbi:alpha/beta fold hydrolase [Streptomyces lucensis]|uniref:alpha/beta fold hydrolase n=1 Tax=Streptomyces lucensis TaxID=67319 RepID=UPI0027E492EE|nr:alpha/beta hydrolase [Streptomyces lucensis]
MADATLAYSVHGTGDPIVMVMGTGGRAHTWMAHQVPAFVAAGHRVVVFDNRGSGPGPVAPFTLSSMVDDTAALVEALDLGPCRIVGASLGAIIAQELALGRPELVRQAVFMATRGRTDMLRRAMVTAEIEQSEVGTRQPAGRLALRRALYNLSPHTLRDDARADTWLTLLEAPPDTGAGYRCQLAATLVPDRLREYAKIRTPSMVITFADDIVTPPFLGGEVADAIDGCRYEEIPLCGHYGYLERPGDVNRIILDFFAAAS